MPATYLDTSTTLGTSDTKVPSQNAVKVYADVYAPRPRTFFVPTYCYTSGNVEKSLRCYQGQHYQAASPSNGDYLIIPIYCNGGETILDLSWYKTTDRSIFDLYVNGLLDSSGYDGYNSSTSITYTQITLSRTIISGWNELKFVVNGKNASSTNYYCGIYGVRLR
jgi:hypothetical protein